MLHSANWNEAANGDVVFQNHYISLMSTKESLGTQCVDTHFLRVRLGQDSPYAWGKSVVNIRHCRLWCGVNGHRPSIGVRRVCRRKFTCVLDGSMALCHLVPWFA
ncbi:hypothetical protein CUC08_Gglean001961 [Alternaria sp. MG1]|jgi:hypothetical protein|nr:hypothetical protein CUC08_Gglean001961 [Alternaria sp. MG1]